MKRHLSTFASLLLAGGLIVWFLYHVDLTRLFHYLEGLQLRWLLAALVANIASVLLRAYRWRVILSSVKRCSFVTLAGATFMGYAFSTILPGRVGEIIRPLYVAGREGVSRVTAVASIVIERLMDLTIILLLLFLFIFTFHPLHASSLITTIRRGALFGSIGLLCLYLFGLLLLLHPTLGTRIERWFSRPALKAFVRNVLEGMAVLRPNFALLWIIILGIVIWVCVALQAWALFLAFAMPYSFTAALMIVGVSAAGFILPTPGGVGGVHKTVQIGLTLLYGVELNLASAYAVVLQAMAMFPLTIIGIAYYLAARVSFKSLIAVRSRGKSLTDGA